MAVGGGLRALGSGAGGAGECGGRGKAGLDEGGASGSWDTAAFLVLVKQLLQSLHVEHVRVVNLFLGGPETLGHRDGAAH